MASGADFYVRGDVGIDASGAQKGIDETEKAAEEAAEKIASKAKKASDTVAGEAEDAAKQVGNSAEQAGQQVQQSVSAKTIAIGNLISSAVQKLVSEVAKIGNQVVSTGIQYNAQMEQYGVALTTLLGNAEAAQTALANIQADAAITPFDTASLVQANEFLIAAGENAEYSRRAINALGNAVSATGGGSDELSRMAQNLQQIANAGEATAADIKQFAYAGIDVYGILADYTGKTTAEVKDMKISYQDLTGALIQASEEGGRFYGAMDSQSQTLNGRIATLKDNATQLAGVLAEGLFEGEKDLVDAAIGWVDTLKQALEENGIAGMLEAGADIAESVGQSIADNAYQAGEKAADIVTYVVNGIADNMGSIVGIGLDIVVNLCAGIADNLPEIMTSATNLVVSFVTELLSAENVSKVISTAETIIANLAQGIIDSLDVIYDAGVETITELVRGLDDENDEVKAAGNRAANSWWAGWWSDFNTQLSNLQWIVQNIMSGDLSALTWDYTDPDLQNKTGNVAKYKAQKAASRSSYLASLSNDSSKAKGQQATDPDYIAPEEEPQIVVVGGGSGSGKSSGTSSKKKTTTEKELTDAQKLANALEALGDGYTYSADASALAADKLAYYEGNVTSAQEKVDKLTYLFEQATAGTNETGLSTEQLGEELLKAESSLKSAKSALEEYKDSLDETKQAAARLETAQEKLSKTWSSSSLKGIKSLLADIKSLNLSGAVQDLASLAWRRLDTSTRQELVDMAQGWIETLDEAFATDGFSGLVKAGSTIADGLLAGLKDKLPEIGEQLGIDLSGFITSDSSEGGSGSVSILSGVAKALSSLGAEAGVVIAVLGVAVASIAGLVAMIKLAADRSEEFQAKLESITEPLSEALDSVLEAVQPVLDAVIDVLGRIIEVLAGIITQISEVLAPVFEALAPVLEALGAALQSILDCVGTLLVSVIKAIEPVLEAIATILQPVAELIATLAELISGILAPALEVLGTVINWILTPIKWVANVIKAIFEGIINFINGVLEVLNDISIFGWHPFDFDLIDSPWDDDDDGSSSSSSSSGSGTISQAYQPIDEVDKYAAAIQTARESALQNAQQSTASLTTGSEEKSSSFFDKMRDALKDLFGTTQIIVPVEIDGQEFARVTAPYLDEELDART